jgi:hypothetical protein
VRWLVFGLVSKFRHLPASRKLRINGRGGGPASDAASGVSSGAIAKEAGMAARNQPGNGWTVVLRRQPARMVEGRPEGGYTDQYEIVCCDCGDHPYLDYREVSLELQRVRGPYPIADGVAAYVKHVRRHQPARATSTAR